MFGVQQLLPLPCWINLPEEMEDFLPPSSMEKNEKAFSSNARPPDLHHIEQPDDGGL